MENSISKSPEVGNGFPFEQMKGKLGPSLERYRDPPAILTEPPYAGSPEKVGFSKTSHFESSIFDPSKFSVKKLLRFITTPKTAEFGEKYGALNRERRTLRRSVFVVDREDKLAYVAYMQPGGVEPDYAEVLGAARKALAG
uniref:Putative thioredoxin peroxidase n=1 Tax=uncultured crenarchaeote MCG TaxID=529375 RepID=B2YI76_9CREN|nr:putative thioredoxin peroxidase [uncultured crenarchaeote MCG]